MNRRTNTRWIERFAAMMLASTTITGVWAQDVAPPTQEEPEEVVVPVKVRWFTLGYHGWSESGNGNGHKLRQYATPARGFQIGELRLVAPANGTSPYASLLMRGAPDADRMAEGALAFDGGRGLATASVSHHSFFDPTPTVIPESSEEAAEATVQYAVSPEIGVFWRFKQKARRLAFEAPKDPTDYRTKSIAGGLEGHVLGGHLGVVVADNRFYDKTATQPNSIQHRLDARYSASPFDTLSVEGHYSQTRVEQVGRHDGEVNSWAVNADWDFSSDSSLLLHMRRDTIDLPVIQNARVQERFLTSARLVHRVRGLAVQLGYQHRESERIRADRSFVDVPAWDTYDAKLSGRFPGGIRYAVSGSWEHLTERATMLTNDPRALYWDDRVRGQVRLSGGNEKFQGYGTYRFRFDQNTPRDVEIRSHNLTLGGSYIFDERTSGYLELAGSQYQVRSTDDLAAYFPGSTSISLGFDHAPRDGESYSLALSWFGTDNDNPLGDKDNNVRSTQFSASYRRALSEDSSLELTYSPWRYTDRVYDAMNYRTTVVGIQFSTRY